MAPKMEPSWPSWAPSWPSWAPGWPSWRHLGSHLRSSWLQRASKCVCRCSTEKTRNMQKNQRFFKVFGVPFFSKFFGERVLCMLARYWRSSAASCRQDVVSCCYVGSTSPRLEPRCANLAPHGLQTRRNGRPGPPKIF